MQSLSHFGSVAKDEADFLPEQWFLKMKYSPNGQVSFVFITRSWYISANPKEAMEHMIRKNYHESAIALKHLKIISKQIKT